MRRSVCVSSSRACHLFRVGPRVGVRGWARRQGAGVGVGLEARDADPARGHAPLLMLGACLGQRGRRVGLAAHMRCLARAARPRRAQHCPQRRTAPKKRAVAPPASAAAAAAATAAASRAAGAPTRFPRGQPRAPSRLVERAHAQLMRRTHACGGAEVQRCRGAEVQRCRGAEVQRCRGGVGSLQCKGAQGWRGARRRLHVGSCAPACVCSAARSCRLGRAKVSGLARALKTTAREKRKVWLGLGVEL